jgi:nucleoid-associated protein YgaU
MAVPMAPSRKVQMEERSTARESDVDTHSGPAKASRGKIRSAALATALGTAAAATVAFSPPASAHADFSAWNRVASCESGGRWHINTGNGFYGGVQFSSGTWAGYGGHRYASQANYASRLEQIEVARRVLAAQGANAWPVCGPRAGLNWDSGHATHRPLPAHPDAAAHRHAKKEHHRHQGTHRHHGRAHHRHHGAHHAAAHHQGAHHHRHYTVHSGDTLSKIAKRFHIEGGWHALYHANKSKLSNPNVLHVGQVLRLP